MKQPCDKNCPRRRVRCFNDCPEWKQYEAERAETRRQRDIERGAKVYLAASETREWQNLTKATIYESRKRKNGEED